MSALGDVAVNVVARATCPSLWDDTYPEHVREQMRPMVYEQAAAALASLDSPEVVQGIAEVLREHRQWLDETACPDGTCDCGAAGIEDHEAHQAQALVAALGGRADR